MAGVKDKKEIEIYTVPIQDKNLERLKIGGNDNEREIEIVTS